MHGRHSTTPITHRCTFDAKQIHANKTKTSLKGTMTPEAIAVQGKDLDNMENYDGDHDSSGRRFRRLDTTDNDDDLGNLQELLDLEGDNSTVLWPRHECAPSKNTH